MALVEGQDSEALDAAVIDDLDGNAVVLAGLEGERGVCDKDGSDDWGIRVITMVELPKMPKRGRRGD